MKPSIVIIGAGSVEFTRELLGDIFSFPELAPSRASSCTTSTPNVSRPPRRSRGATAGKRRPSPRSSRRRTGAGLDGADYVINVIQVGMHEATVRDFEIPAEYGLNQTIADTIGIGGIFRGLRTFPSSPASRRTCSRSAPTPGCSTTPTR